jgi:4-amino-4-deoxy-L-arabinose transferase-like glycosyltransferase
VSLSLPRHQAVKVKLLLLLGLTLLAAFFRLYRIDAIPPGDRYDPAYYGVDAIRILEGERPIFFSTNFGREALFSYLVAIYVALFGIVPQAMYVTSAIVGILTVPAVYLVAEELLATEEGAWGRFGGLLAALVVAISYWHLNWSRFGVRAILLPLFAAVTCFLLWRALRTDSKGYFAAAGFFLGLSMYTYQAARLLPLLVILGLVYVAVSRRRLTRRDLVNLFIVGLVALVVFAPLGYYFLTNPGSFSQRIGQTFILNESQKPTENLQALANGFMDTLLAFSTQGDQEPTTNLPGRPILNVFLSVLFFGGVFISLLRLKKPEYLFVLTWLAVMLIPAVLSQQGPIAKRAIGTLPAVAVLIAIGALVSWEMLNKWITPLGARWGKGAKVALGAAIVAGFVYSAVLTYYDYFVVWARDPDQFTHFEVGPTAIGQYLATVPPEVTVYVSPVPPDHPSVIFNSRDRPEIKGYDGRACLVVPEQSKLGATYVVVPGEDPNSLGLLHAYIPQGEIVAEGPLHYQQPYFLAFHVPPDTRTSIAPAYPMEVNWGNRIKLLGYDLDSEAYQPGDMINLTLYYQAMEEMDTGYTLFAHIEGPDNPVIGGRLWGQSDSEPCRRSYPTSAWTLGEIIRDQLTIVLDDDAPPGEYQLRVGFYLLENMVRLPASDASGLPLPDDAALLRKWKVEAE